MALYLLSVPLLLDFVFEFLVVPKQQLLIFFQFLLIVFELFDFSLQSLVSFNVVLLNLIDALVLFVLQLEVYAQRLILFIKVPFHCSASFLGWEFLLLLLLDRILRIKRLVCVAGVLLREE
jgi:hypothetical protein